MHNLYSGAIASQCRHEWVRADQYHNLLGLLGIYKSNYLEADIRKFVLLFDQFIVIQLGV